MKIIFKEDADHLPRPGKKFLKGVEYVLDNNYANYFIGKGVAEEVVEASVAEMESIKKSINLKRKNKDGKV